MTVYAVALLSIHDREEYANYEAGFLEIFARHDGKILSVDEAPEILEGEWPHTRTVLLEFPSAQALDDWYRSDDYQALAQHRFNASTGSIVRIQGLG